MGYTILEKIDITAGAIRSRAREFGVALDTITERQAADFAEAQANECPNTIAAQFYLTATDRQWKRIYNKVKNGQ